MPLEEKIVSGANWQCRMPVDGERSFELAVNGRCRMALGRVTLGGFSENSSLTKKLRLHESQDGLSNSFESGGIIPFGCEYSVERKIDLLSCGIGSLTLDLSAVNGGAVGNVALEEVVFPGPWVKLEFLPFGSTEFVSLEPEAEKKDFYSSGEPPVMLRLTADDGVQTEFAAGTDLWRHRAGIRTAGATGEFAITGNAGEIRFRREIVRFAADAVIEKRPWRFKNLFGWRLPEDTRTVPENLPVLPQLDSPHAKRTTASGAMEKCFCMASAPANKFLKELVRKTDGNLVFSGLDPELCYNSAHQDRPGKGALEHFDLEDWVNFYLWANRQLARRGLFLKLFPAPDGRFAGSVCVANLSK